MSIHLDGIVFVAAVYFVTSMQMKIAKRIGKTLCQSTNAQNSKKKREPNPVTVYKDTSRL
jgi:hypothetical protein